MDDTIVAGLDLETTGLSTTNDRIIEVGIVLWKWRAAKPVAVFNALVNDATPNGVPPQITRITGITDDELKFGHPWAAVAKRTLSMISKAEYVVAHNGNGFDNPMLANNLALLGLALPDVPWIDSRSDVPYPENCGSRKLTYLAAEHGFVNPFPHRAFSDVLTMLKICSMYELDLILKLQSAETITVQALVSYEDRQMAAQAGFHWDKPGRKWLMQIKEPFLPIASKRWAFAHTVVE